MVSILRKNAEERRGKWSDPIGSPATYRWRTGLKSVLDAGITRRDELLRELDDIAARNKVP